MFELFDTPRPDRGIQRRHFLKIGGMAAGGLSLPQLLAAEAAQGASDPLQTGGCGNAV